MESPAALFAPDHYVQTPVPAPLQLFNLIRFPLVTHYPTNADGLIERLEHTYQRNEVVYPDGSRFTAHVNSDREYGLPTAYDVDYLLGLLRLADEQGASEGGELSVSLTQILEATNPEGAIGGTRGNAAKRMIQRFGGTEIRTNLFVVLGSAPEGRPSAGTPDHGYEETTEWVLKYGLKGTVIAGSQRDVIKGLKINPVWLRHGDPKLTTWVDIDVHNRLSGALAKSLYLRLVIWAAQGRLDHGRVLPLESWEEVLGMSQADKPNKRAGKLDRALAALKEKRVLADYHIDPKGYEIHIEPAGALHSVKLTTPIGRLDPVRTRTLLYHLTRYGMAGDEAREVLSRYGMRVEEILQYAHFVETEKGGLDARGEPIRSWLLWIRKGLKDSYSLLDAEYATWLARQKRQFEPRPAPAPSPALPPAPDPAANPEPEAVEPELPDNAWGQALGLLREEIPPQTFRSVLLPTWLERVTQHEVHVRTENDFAREWIEKKYAHRLEEVLSGILGRPVALRIQQASSLSPSL